MTQGHTARSIADRGHSPAQPGSICMNSGEIIWISEENVRSSSTATHTLTLSTVRAVKR